MYHPFYRWFCAACLLVVTISCQKNESDEDSAPAKEDLVLPGSLDINCGDSSCFGKSSTALQISNDETQLQTMQMFAWIVTGFPDKSSYDNVLSQSETAKELIPQGGLVANLESTRKSVISAISKQYAGVVSSCSELHTSGTIEMASKDGSASFATPTLTAPASFRGTMAGKKYSKAVNFTSKDKTVKAHIEFMCDYQGMAVNYRKYDGSTTTVQYVLYYDRNNSKKLDADLYFIDNSKTVSSSSLELGLMLRATNDNEVESWVSRSGDGDADGTNVGYRYTVHGDLSKNQISWFAVEAGTGNNSDGLTDTEWAASTNVTGTTVAGDAAPSSASNDQSVIGCADGWDQAKSEQTVKGSCSGLELNSAPAPVFDESKGNMSLAWVRSNLREKVAALKD